MIRDTDLYKMLPKLIGWFLWLNPYSIFVFWYQSLCTKLWCFLRKGLGIFIQNPNIFQSQNLGQENYIDFTKKYFFYENKSKVLKPVFGYFIHGIEQK